MAAKSTRRFAPELFELFTQAYDKQIILRFPEERQARRFAVRMNDLRSAMRHENHPMLTIAEAVTVSYKGYDPDAGVHCVMLSPADSELVNIIRQQIDFEEDGNFSHAKGPKEIPQEIREVKSSSGKSAKPKSSTEALKGFMGRTEEDKDEE